VLKGKVKALKTGMEKQEFLSKIIEIGAQVKNCDK